MPTLAQRFREEFMETLGPQLKEKGREENAKETALRMLKKGFDPDTIIDITGLNKTDIEKLAPRSSI
jgi:predicted transposase/invertase (TIGR01784 family)